MRALEAEAFQSLLGDAFRRTDTIFARLAPDELLARPISLRHPFVFYLGHLPAFAWNQIVRGALDEGPLHEDFEILFERGIDPANDDGARAASIEAWPRLDEVIAYRDRVRARLLERVPDVLARRGEPLCERGRVLHLVIEHELMHQETLCYMLQEHASQRGAGERQAFATGPGRAAEPRRIKGGEVTLGADLEAIDFGWDNEIGHRVEAVGDFTIDSLPVRNSDYRGFLRARGEETRIPRSWSLRGGELRVKTVSGEVPFAVAEGWPVQVTGVEARAYCEARGGRLPTEAELRYLAARSERTCATRGVRTSRGNLGFKAWAPVPVGSGDRGDRDPAAEVEELIGNGWEWTSTAFGPLPGFEALDRTYPGYSADFFDGEHDVVFGASWATDEKLVRPSFRNWYRRDYPYVFSSFRVARPG